jgi:phosphotriesterase-related protein
MHKMPANCIMTVNGPISNSDLGFCHSHEHLFLAEGQSAKLNPALKLDNFDKTVAELRLFKKSGGASIIDAQPVGCGRIAQYLVQASVNTGINIIASTGFHKLIFYPADHWIHSMNESELARLFISEFEDGMYIDGDSNLPTRRITAKPGVIKTASDIDGINGKYHRLFEAAAEACKETGAPILSHTEMGKAALEQIQLFTDYGISVDSLIICHLDRKVDDINYHLQVAETGVYMEFDTIGRLKYHSDEAEAKFIVKMVERGYEDRILIGLDTTRERMKSYGGSLGLDYISSSFIPLLKKFGLSDEIIKKFTVYNPARAFISNKNKI